ncbi:MAG: hypothetical protein LBT12_07205 [Oscillospiraceae bacterium]|jgi:hypothetical protein|nr:hypothetical protein [Oscillospiraceae bacterium]
MKEKRSMGLNMGSASIIMLFAVLCLTVLAALSLLSANSQLRLTQRSAAVMESYYDADLRASEIYERVLKGDYSEVEEIVADGGDTYYNYTVTVDIKSEPGGKDGKTPSLSLDVSLRETGGAFSVYKWKIIESDDWNPNDDINLWGGDPEEDVQLWDEAQLD